jgi:hypothetical protein
MKEEINSYQDGDQSYTDTNKNIVKRIINTKFFDLILEDFQKSIDPRSFIPKKGLCEMNILDLDSWKDGLKNIDKEYRSRIKGLAELLVI